MRKSRNSMHSRNPRDFPQGNASYSPALATWNSGLRCGLCHGCGLRRPGLPGGPTSFTSFKIFHGFYTRNVLGLNWDSTRELGVLGGPRSS